MRVPSDPPFQPDTPRVASWVPVQAVRVPPFTGIASGRQISDHAAAQAARRVRLDPRVLAWAPRSPIPPIRADRDGVPGPVRAALDETRAYLLQIARHGRFTRELPPWLIAGPDRDTSRDAVLLVGDDVALLLGCGKPGRARALPWMVQTVVTRNGLDSPYARELRHARRDRIQAREHRPERWFSNRAYHRPRRSTTQLLAEYDCAA